MVGVYASRSDGHRRPAEAPLTRAGSARRTSASSTSTVPCAALAVLPFSRALRGRKLLDEFPQRSKAQMDMGRWGEASWERWWERQRRGLR